MERTDGTAAEERAALRTLDGPAVFACLYGILSLTASPRVPLLLLLPAAALLMPGWEISRRLALPAIYRHAWRAAAVAVVVGLAVAHLFAGLHPESCLTGIALFLLLRGWFNTRGLREHLEIWCLGLILLLVGSLHGSGLAGLAVLIGWTIASFHLLNLMAVLRLRGPRVNPYQAAPHALRTIYGLLPLTALLAVMFQVLLPRLPQESADPRWATRMTPLEREAVRTGFSESVTLTSLTSIQESEAVAFLVVDPGPTFEPAAGRFRVGTLDAFDGWRWTRSAALQEKASVTDLQDSAFELPGGSSVGERHEFLLIRPVDFPPGLVPLSEKTAAVAALQLGTTVVFEDDGRLSMQGPRPIAEYLLALDPTDASRVRRGAVMASHRQISAAVREAVAPLANRFRTGTVRERAAAMESWLRRNGTYSRELNFKTEGPAALSEFLQNGPRGHCELFATVMAMSLREQGIPTRLVTGMVGAEPLPGSPGRPRLFQVSQNRAHAWVEVWTDDEGWLSFDPTPPLPFNMAMARTEGRQMVQALNDQEHSMVAWLDGYDYGAQQRLAGSLWQGITDPISRWEYGALPRTASLLRQNAVEPEILALAAALLLLNAGLWGWKYRHLVGRIRHVYLLGGNSVPPLFHEILRVAGITGPIARARSPRELVPARTPAWCEVLELYERWRFAGRDPQLEAAIRARLRVANKEKSEFGSGN